MKRLGVIIPFFKKDEGLLRKCIRTIIEQENTLESNLNIVIVEGDSLVRAKIELYPILIEVYKSTGQPLLKGVHIRIIDHVSTNMLSAQDIGYIALRDLVDFIAVISVRDEWTPGFLEQEYRLLSDVGVTSVRKNGSHIFKPVKPLS